jgi:KaiC/GvpD/RAD55 family RecA-like ATPase
LSQSKGNVDRIASGIEGLDDLIKGGFPKGSFISVWGFDGYAESIFSKQFCYEGLKSNEKVLYVATTETEFVFQRQMDEYGWATSNMATSLNFLEIPETLLTDLNAASRLIYDEFERLKGVDRCCIVMTPLVHLSPPAHTLGATKIWRDRFWRSQSVGIAVYTRGGIPTPLEVSIRASFDGVIDFLPSEKEEHDGYVRISKLHRTKTPPEYIPFNLEPKIGIVLKKSE